MKAAVISTGEIVEVNGVKCRIWKGATVPGGVPFLLFVASVAVDKAHDQSAFERELTETVAPSLDPTPAQMRPIDVFNLRAVL